MAKHKHTSLFSPGGPGPVSSSLTLVNLVFLASLHKHFVSAINCAHPCHCSCLQCHCAGPLHPISRCYDQPTEKLRVLSCGDETSLKHNRPFEDYMDEGIFPDGVKEKSVLRPATDQDSKDSWVPSHLYVYFHQVHQCLYVCLRSLIMMIATVIY